MQGGFGMGGGSGGMGGRGIFNVGKAQVTKLSKKQKDKVRLYFHFLRGYLSTGRHYFNAMDIAVQSTIILFYW
jgi:hypothetical protein